MQQTIIYILLFLSIPVNAQFHFSGKVNDTYKNATAYLSIVDNYNQTHLFLAEQILQESKIDSIGEFHFKGDFLSSNSNIYNIHIDNCHTDINDYKHLLNHCEESKNILFISNNTDVIHFPLNSLNQVFCESINGKPHTQSIQKIDSLQDELFSNLSYNTNDKQRNITYKSSFEALQQFSKSLNNPLAELYTYQVYANNESIYHSFYVEDLKTATYYLNLLVQLKKYHPKYAQQLQQNLIQDQYPLLETKKNNYKTIAMVLGILFLASMLLNFFFFKKHQIPKKVKTNYKNTLTPQEQKILELMHNKLTNKEIATSLFISVSTVKTHINNIYSKLNINSRKDIDGFF